jgi:hypothetical protein
MLTRGLLEKIKEDKFFRYKDSFVFVEIKSIKFFQLNKKDQDCLNLTIFFKEIKRNLAPVKIYYMEIVNNKSSLTKFFNFIYMGYFITSIKKLRKR